MTTARHVSLLDAVTETLSREGKIQLAETSAGAKTHLIRLHNALVRAAEENKKIKESLLRVRRRISYDQQANSLDFDGEELDGSDLNEDLMYADDLLGLTSPRVRPE